MRACFFIAVQTVMAHGMDCSGTETWRDTIKDRDLTGQTHVITGGDTGIGYYQALALASANAQVVMACRDSAKPTGKCQTAVANITAITGNQRVSAIPCDLSSFASVRSFASALEERVSKVDALTNNAGIAWNDPRLPVGPITDDGFRPRVPGEPPGPPPCSWRSCCPSCAAPRAASSTSRRAAP